VAISDPDLTSSGDENGALLAALRAGHEGAFAQLVDRHYGSMLRVARGYVATKEAAEDVVQEAGMGVLQGLDRFEGRSSLKTWLFRILINKAITRGTRDSRSVPFSSLGPDEPAVDPSRFRDSGRWTGFWAVPPSASEAPERILVAKEARAKIDEAISIHRRRGLRPAGRERGQSAGPAPPGAAAAKGAPA
jgi:RNA polymerase sigma-70 factor (ECF subfamily)